MKVIGAKNKPLLIIFAETGRVINTQIETTKFFLDIFQEDGTLSDGIIPSAGFEKDFSEYANGWSVEVKSMKVINLKEIGMTNCVHCSEESRECILPLGNNMGISLINIPFEHPGAWRFGEFVSSTFQLNYFVGNGIAAKAGIAHNTHEVILQR